MDMGKNPHIKAQPKREIITIQALYSQYISSKHNWKRDIIQTSGIKWTFHDLRIVEDQASRLITITLDVILLIG
ncbi:MAG: hypothetical protein WC156_14250 [Pedobacter sp.]